MKRILFILMFIIFSLTGYSNSSETYIASVREHTEISENKASEQTIISTHAIYVGLIDTHSFEVIIDNKPLALQMSKDQMSLLEPLKTNEQISIEYYYNEGTSQYILVKADIHH
jgi:hypothetical protein